MTSTSVFVLLLSLFGAVFCAPVLAAGGSQSDAGPSDSAAFDTCQDAMQSPPTIYPNSDDDCGTMANPPQWLSSYAPDPALLRQFDALCSMVESSGWAPFDARPEETPSLPIEPNSDDDCDYMADLPLWISSYAPVPDLVQEIDALCTRVESGHWLRPARDTELVLLFDRILALGLPKRAVDAVLRRCECLAPQAAQRFLQLKRSIVIPFVSTNIHQNYNLHMTRTALATVRNLGVQFALRRVRELPFTSPYHGQKRLPAVVESYLITAFVLSGKSELLFDPDTLLTLLDVGIRFHAALVLFQVAVPPTCNLMDVLPLFRTLWINTWHSDQTFPLNLLIQASVLRLCCSQTTRSQFWAMPIRDHFVRDLPSFSLLVNHHCDADRAYESPKTTVVKAGASGHNCPRPSESAASRAIIATICAQYPADDEAESEWEFPVSVNELFLSSGSDDLDESYRSQDRSVRADSDDDASPESGSDPADDDAAQPDEDDDGYAMMLKLAGFPFYRGVASRAAVAALTPALRRAMKHRKVL